ncbi:MAG: glycoside hydrolase family 1 protein [Patescibacteria group bacterium]|nr:glycoside hydrolase family 1 protein [Patescibacteria group bacterium]MDD5554036.1 glycoside hydrolase family 1 protein [Patescibacteria group bacterium]
MSKNNKKILKFPKNFLWGVSTSAYQIEGGIINDWSRWEKSEVRIKKLERKGKNPEDFICGQACDSYHRYEEDAKLAKGLNCGAYRLGIEWARIEPEQGKWDLKEVEHYRKVLQNLKDNELKVVLTLWHWTNPVWFADRGGWADKESVNYYLRYVEFVANELGDFVDYWITLNEPMAHIGFGYITGSFPPNRKLNIIGAFKTARNLISAHNLAYKKIHKIIKNAKVGFTSLTDYFEPANKYNPLDIRLNSIVRYFHHRYYFNRVKDQLDFIAFDYYFHQRISWLPPFKDNLNKEVSDMGWEIYPEGIYYVLKYFARFKKPIFVMENGIADEDDKERKKFIIDHLSYVHKAIAEGVNVRGYFYWSLLDNFEWAAGWSPKFGLYELDRKTFERTARPSAEAYSEICKNNYIEISKK